MGVPIPKPSFNAQTVTFHSMTPIIGNVELESYEKDGAILVTHKSLLSWLACNMGPGKLIQTCQLVAAPHSTENKPVWVCNIQSQTMGDYSDVGEASAKSTDEIERNFASTIAQNRAKDRAILFYLNLEPMNGIRIMSETELISGTQEATERYTSAAKECYNRKEAHVAFPAQAHKPVQQNVVTAPVVPAPAPAAQTQFRQTPKPVVPAQTKAQPVTKPVAQPAAKPAAQTVMTAPVAHAKPTMQEIATWKETHMYDYMGQQILAKLFLRKIEFDKDRTELKSYCVQQVEKGDEVLLYYLASKRIYGYDMSIYDH